MALDKLLNGPKPIALQYSVNNLLIFSFQHAAGWRLASPLTVQLRFGLRPQVEFSESHRSGLSFKLHKEEMPDRSVLSQTAPNRLADPCQPLFEMRAEGPVMSSAFDT